jgi:hypothetical protein
MLKRWLKKLYHLSIDLGPRSQEPYATHVPILVGVAAAFKPKRLIEFGSGSFSTLSFLDNVAFGSLEEVQSYENNKEWFEQVQKKLPDNSRVDLQFFPGDMHRAIAGADVAAADMIFIDDSPAPTPEERVKTVKEVSKLCGQRPVVVLHDYDILKLRLGARNFEHLVVFDAFNPQSCAVWHGHPERRPILEEVNRTIRQHADNVPLTNVRAWIDVFTAKSNGLH